MVSEWHRISRQMDTFYQAEANDRRLLEIMAAEDRAILTRDRWVFKNTPASSQPSLHPVYGVGCHTRQFPSFRSPTQRGAVKKSFKPQKSAKVSANFQAFAANATESNPPAPSFRWFSFAGFSASTR